MESKIRWIYFRGFYRSYLSIYKFAYTAHVTEMAQVYIKAILQPTNGCPFEAKYLFLNEHPKYHDLQCIHNDSIANFFFQICSDRAELYKKQTCLFEINWLIQLQLFTLRFHWKVMNMVLFYCIRFTTQN